MTTYIGTCELCAKTFRSSYGLQRHLKNKICQGGNTPGCVNKAVSLEQRKALPFALSCPCGGQFKHQKNYENHIKNCELPENSVKFVEPVSRNRPTSTANIGMNRQYYQDNKERLKAKARANYYKKKAKKLAAASGDDREQEDVEENTGETFLQPKRGTEL